jgi:hypothetical protein
MLTASTNGLALVGGLDGPETVGQATKAEMSYIAQKWAQRYT